MRRAVATLLASLAHADPGTERFSAGLIGAQADEYFTLDAIHGIGAEAHFHFARFDIVTFSVGARALVIPSPPSSSSFDRYEHFDGRLALRGFFSRNRCKSFFFDLHAGYAHDFVRRQVEAPTFRGDEEAPGFDFGARFGAMFYAADGFSLGGVLGVSMSVLDVESQGDEGGGGVVVWFYTGLLAGFGG